MRYKYLGLAFLTLLFSIISLISTPDFNIRLSFLFSILTSCIGDGLLTVSIDTFNNVSTLYVLPSDSVALFPYHTILLKRPSVFF